ncbi:FAD-NAD(P)-binding protein [Citrobacter amalonaticus]|uniref:FAD-NAD(P)-binding protein n=1 Tax=Citrobacter amalonaticus TaxID=35703 RepID=UPI00300DA25F
MKKIAIIGAGPTGIYTFFSLLNTGQPLEITVFEKEKEAGVGMPYRHAENDRMMLANIASIEIPPLFDTWLEWLQAQDKDDLGRYGVQKESLHHRQFLPRILLGEYFRAQFLHAIAQAEKRGFNVRLYESCSVTDIEATASDIQIWTEKHADPLHVDLAVIATGHVWPEDDESTRAFYPSPWSGLMDAQVPAAKVGILGTSLSGLDAAMAVAVQHGTFHEAESHSVTYVPDNGSEALEITLMSRTGILPEADFYCPIPYEPLEVVTEKILQREIDTGSDGLLDRVFTLIQQELTLADPEWAKQIALTSLDADSFPSALFAHRKRVDPFAWAAANLEEVEANKRDKRTVAWRYTLLRLHEVVQDIVPHLSEQDGKRFSAGLARVFIDNYAAIPSESIRRMLALHAAGILRILTLGEDYEKVRKADCTEILIQNECHRYDIFIDARGQKPLKTKDLPFARLRRQLLSCGDDIPDVGEDYTLQAPDIIRGRIAFGALPYLMHDRPFIQGLVACQEMGAAMAKAVSEPATRVRRRLRPLDQ